MTESVRQTVRELTGADVVGIARAGAVARDAQQAYASWLRRGCHAGMSYLSDHEERKRDSRAACGPSFTPVSLIVCAFSYYSAAPGPRLPVARYARGRDYHRVIGERLRHAAETLTAQLGAECRVAVDTAPLRERYWAQQAGVGFIGRNNTLIVPGKGSYFFLGEILTDMALEADPPCTLSCGDCGACLRACPGGALPADGSALDARRCLSYLTVEHRGPWPGDAPRPATLAGCDVCQEVCPHNRTPLPATIAELTECAALATLTPAAITGGSGRALSRLLADTSLSRIRPADLRRNLGALTGGEAPAESPE